MDIKKLPEGTIERLSKYRRCLTTYCKFYRENIFSHELARNLHLTPEQVRRDMMLIGHSGSHKNGYNVEELVEKISEVIDCRGKTNVAVFGLGNLGKAIVRYLQDKETQLNIAAIFDINPEKINPPYMNIDCFHPKDMKKVIKDNRIGIAVLTLPGDDAQEVAQEMVINGVTGIMNFTPVPLKLPDGVFLEEYDILTSLEKVAFFSQK